MDVSGDSSGELGLQYNDDDIKRHSLTHTPNPTQPPNPIQTTTST
jgi:hypothetical protein